MTNNGNNDELEFMHEDIGLIQGSFPRILSVDTQIANKSWSHTFAIFSCDLHYVYVSGNF
jgi:hypothetical protein